MAPIILARLFKQFVLPFREVGILHWFIRQLFVTQAGCIGAAEFLDQSLERRSIRTQRREADEQHVFVWGEDQHRRLDRWAALKIERPLAELIKNGLDPGRLIGAVNLRDAALATSGPRFGLLGSAETAGVAIIDPATRAPAPAVHGATVRAGTCMLADALTKAVMVAPTRAPGLLGSLRASALIVRANGDVCVTDDWGKAVRLAA